MQRSVGLPRSIEHHVYQLITTTGLQGQGRPGWGIACCSSAATIINLNNPAMAPEPPPPPPAAVPPVTAAAQVSESHCWNCSTDGPTAADGKACLSFFLFSFRGGHRSPLLPAAPSSFVPHARATDGRRDGAAAAAGRTIALGIGRCVLSCGTQQDILKISHGKLETMAWHYD